MVTTLKEPMWYGSCEIMAEEVNKEEGTVELTFALKKDKDGNRTKEIQHQPITLDLDVYNASVTKTVSDWTALRDRRVRFMVGEVLGLLLKRNILLDEFDYFSALISQSINESMKRANEFLWGVNSEEKSMQDVQNVLKTHMSDPTVSALPNPDAKTD